MARGGRQIDGIALGSILVGAVFAYAGLKGYSITVAFQNIVQGKAPGNQPQANPINTASVTPPSSSPPGAPGAPGSSPPAASAKGAGAGSNQALAKSIVPPSWQTGAQWNALVALWNQESGWSNTADTRKTGLDPANATVFAYGIAQARPYSKMPKSAWPPDKGGSSNPTAQIVWGVGYIQSRYGTPLAAWQHEQAHGWY